MGLGGGTGAGAGRGPFALLGTEVCATLLLLCWLCCWPDDTNSDTSSPEYPRKPVLVESGSRRRSGHPFSRRMGSSAVSLHLPSTSGYAKQPLSAHRSHEEIRSRRKSHHEAVEPETRYHSAPSVIDEVIHRRDWDRSTKDLYIPLKSESEFVKTGSTPSLSKAPFAEAESSSVECLKADNNSLRVCKKHYTNIKTSKGKKCKESNKHDIKDTDATEAPTGSFYIGDELEHSPTRASATDYEEFIEHERLTEERNRSIYKAKDAKQSFNESIRLKEMPRKGLVPLEEGEVRYGFTVEDDLDRIDRFDGIGRIGSIGSIDRSGAVHHTIESRTSLRHYPAPSVETIGYEGGACYLAEVGSVSQLRAGVTLSPHAHAAQYAALYAASRAGAAPPPPPPRARHASDGDILAPPAPRRPESGAFSESDLDLELESEEIPPAYEEVQLNAAPHRKETAI